MYCNAIGRKFTKNCRQNCSVHAAMVVGAEAIRNLQPKCKAMPTPVGVWWAFAKNEGEDIAREGGRITGTSAPPAIYKALPTLREAGLIFKLSL
jgi:hypothetical protein